MYIADVIENLRQRDLELQRQIHELRLAVHLLEREAGLQQKTDVSRETERQLEIGDVL